MKHEEALADENRRLSVLKAHVDRAQADIREGRIPLEQVEETIAGLRQEAGWLFPGQEATFDLIYRPRLERAARERRGQNAGRPISDPGKVGGTWEE